MATNEKSGGSPQKLHAAQLQDAERHRNVQAKEELIKRILNPYEPVIMRFQSILAWENPTHSAVMLVAVHGVLWLATTIRFFTMAGLASCAVVLFDLWLTSVWPESRVPTPSDELDGEGWTPIHPKLLSVPELCHHLAELWVTVIFYLEQLINLRQREPPRFFVATTMALTIIGIIGCYIPGIMIAYVTVMSLILWPCLAYHNFLQKAYEKIEPMMMKLEYSLKIKRKRSKRSKKRKKKTDVSTDRVETESDTDLEEFCPSPDPMATAALARAITDSEDESPEGSPKLLTPRVANSDSAQNTDEDIPTDGESSFTAGLSELPSFDDTQLDDFLDETQQRQEQNESESRSEKPAADRKNSSEMHFVSSHFKESSDSENEIAEGLDFDDVDTDLTPTNDTDKTVGTEEGSGLTIGGLSTGAVSQTVTSFMASTMSGLSKLGQTVKAAATSASSHMTSTAAPEQQLEKVSEEAESVESVNEAAGPSETEGKEVPRSLEMTESDILADFEFLDQEDFHDHAVDEMKPTEEQTEK